ncbi:hypothetical protein AAIH57_05020 [Paenibacillus sp. MABNR03]|uniref:DUF4179 domain-containing protein n=1 Tax=Paenibacillus xylanilyticus TaxID=248903 RepID=A0A7Y6C1V4_9BACL|nr:hypothetical protein [Paenibacillus xylanilyticus]NUU78951.1 hypothetical protein [Paenibacillus xylanilyticus]
MDEKKIKVVIYISRSKDHLTEQNLMNIKNIFYEKAGLQVDAQSQMKNSKTSSNSKMRHKIIYISAASVLSLTVVTGAAAALGVIDLSSVLRFLSADRINILQPVNKLSEDQGIRMQTLGAVRDGNTAEIYVSFTDLTEDRIDATLDIYSYHVSGGQANNAQIVYYDAEEKTAVVRFLIQGKKLKSRMTLSVSSFLSGASKDENYDVQLNLSSLLSTHQQNDYVTLNQMKDDISGWSGESSKIFNEEGSIHVLQRDKTHIPLEGMDWLYISNIGFVDGKLHIQVNPNIEMGSYNYGHFFFTDKQGTPQNIPMNTIYYGSFMKDGIGYGGDYIEYIFDISDISQLENLQLKGKFTTYDQIIKGQWETSFNLKEEALSKTGDATVHLDKDTDVKVTVSSVGVTLKGMDMNRIPLEDLRLEIYLNDGTQITPKGGFVRIEDTITKWISTQTIPIQEVNHIMFNGQKVILRDKIS